MSDYFKKIYLVDSKKEVALFFDSMKDVQSFSNETIENYAPNRPNYDVIEPYKSNNIDILVTKMIKQSGKDWYGTKDTSWAGQEITKFLRSDEIDSDLKKIKTRLAKVNIKDLEQRKRIKFTEKEIGIFSFDLASLGLVRVYDYYSPLTKGIVNAFLVDSYENQNGDLIFFYVGTPYIPRHEVIAVLDRRDKRPHHSRQF
jgi:hypothetical protein